MAPYKHCKIIFQRASIGKWCSVYCREILLGTTRKFPDSSCATSLSAPANSRGARTYGVRPYKRIQPQTGSYRLFGRACIARAPDLEGRRGVWKFQRSAAILVWRYRGSQEEGWTRRFHWDRTLIICYPLHEHYMFTNTHVGSQSMITLLNNTQGLKIIENTVIFFSQNCSEKSQTLREGQPYTDH